MLEAYSSCELVSLIFNLQTPQLSSPILFPFYFSYNSFLNCQAVGTSGIAKGVLEVAAALWRGWGAIVWGPQRVTIPMRDFSLSAEASPGTQETGVGGRNTT